MAHEANYSQYESQPANPIHLVRARRLLGLLASANELSYIFDFNLYKKYREIGKKKCVYKYMGIFKVC